MGILTTLVRMHNDKDQQNFDKAIAVQREMLQFWPNLSDDARQAVLGNVQSLYGKKLGLPEKHHGLIGTLVGGMMNQLNPSPKDQYGPKMIPIQEGAELAPKTQGAAAGQGGAVPGERLPGAPAYTLRHPLLSDEERAQRDARLEIAKKRETVEAYREQAKKDGVSPIQIEEGVQEIWTGHAPTRPAPFQRPFNIIALDDQGVPTRTSVHMAYDENGQQVYIKESTGLPIPKGSIVNAQPPKEPVEPAEFRKLVEAFRGLDSTDPAVREASKLEIQKSKLDVEVKGLAYRVKAGEFSDAEALRRIANLPGASGAPGAPGAAPSQSAAPTTSTSAGGPVSQQLEQAYPAQPGRLGLLDAIAGQESSGGNPARGIPPGGTQVTTGRYQITDGFAKTWGKPGEDPGNPEQGREMAARYFADTIPKVGIRQAIKGYYGTGQAPKGYPTSDAYADQVLARMGLTPNGLPTVGTTASTAAPAVPTAAPTTAPATAPAQTPTAAPTDAAPGQLSPTNPPNEQWERNQQMIYDGAIQKILTGKTPTMGARGKGPLAYVALEMEQKASELIRQMGFKDISETYGIREALKANGAALRDLNIQSTKMEWFENTLKANVARAQELSNKYDRSGMPFWNRFTAWLQTGMGDEDVQNFGQQVQVVLNEYAKIMQGSTGAAGAHVSEVEANQKYLNDRISKEGFQSIVNNVILPDIQNRKVTADQKRADLINQMNHPFAGYGNQPPLPQPKTDTTNAPRPAVDPDDPEGIVPKWARKPKKK